MKQAIHTAAHAVPTYAYFLLGLVSTVGFALVKLTAALKGIA